MQRLDLDLSDFTRRAGSMLVTHADTDLRRGLEPGETVLVRDRDRRHWLATVRDISFDLTDTHYRLELGAAVRADEAELLVRSAGADEAARGDIDLADVVALLRQARAVAAQRSALAALPR